MNKTVYFPTFEPPSENWLKFALLYMDNFNPIIPYSAITETSRQYQDVINNTNLITPYEPRYEQGERASIKAIEFVDRIHNQPYRYSGLLNRVNVNRRFTNNDEKTFKIYREKFSMNWEEYCRENDFSIETDGGILVSEELAFLYMTFLAEEIAFEEGMSIITDNTKFDNFLNYKRTIPRAAKTRNEFAHGVMSLVIPQNISEISINTLIDFRNANRNLIRSFNVELDNSLNNIQEGITDRVFIDRFNNIYSELSSEILAQGFGFATIPLGTYLLINNPLSNTAEYIQEVIGAIGILLAGKNAIRGKWREISNLHNCRRYITNLGRLG